jgi:prepilin-type N-terminal cleavage/methylation domain-containing protein
MINSMKSRNQGFTIVELLIVIVVIAILAAITIVAFNGVQRRAYNTARVSNASNAVKLISAYITAYGKYPSNTSYIDSCVGNGFADNNTHCWDLTDGSPTSRDATLNDTELAKLSSLPNNTTPPVQISAWKALGPVYSYSSTRTVNGVLNPLLIRYFLDGANQPCGLSNIVSTADGTAYTLVTTTPRNSGSAPDGTLCIVAVSGP